MIWPNDLAAYLVNATSATGQMEGMMVLAGLSLWYSVVIGGVAAVGAVVVAMFHRNGGK